MNEQKRLQNCVMNTRSPNIWRYKLLIRLKLIIKFTTSDQAGIEHASNVMILQKAKGLKTKIKLTYLWIQLLQSALSSCTKN